MFVATKLCHDKMILVAAPANDTFQHVDSGDRVGLLTNTFQQMAQKPSSGVA